jgi:hypothetical protein
MPGQRQDIATMLGDEFAWNGWRMKAAGGCLSTIASRHGRPHACNVAPEVALSLSGHRE